MRICLIGPGIMSIPPKGWGAVEILIWDYYCELKKQGHKVDIINKKRKTHYEQVNINSNYCRELINEINEGFYDFVHLHYDVLYHILPHLKCKRKAITSHYPYIDQVERHTYDGFNNIFNFMVSNDNIINFVLADKDMKMLEKYGADKKKIVKMKNGINSSLFNFEKNPICGNRTLYLGKIDKRKNQHNYQSISYIDFVGPLNCNKFDKTKNYIGSWTRDEVHNNLTKYGNLLLLSNGEADPLVVKEALISGLGVVVNFTSGQNLDEKPFITIIPDEKMNDLVYIKNKLDENRKTSIKMRGEIRNYGISKFDISVECKKYIDNLVI